MNWRRLARILFRYVIPATVIALVALYFYDILSKPELRNVDYAFRIEWLIPAAFLYLITHTIFASFWWSLLHDQGYPASYATGVRAYFISQVGKYVPGKVWVIFIRMSMLGASAKDKAIVGLTATYETLTSMGAGAIVAAILIAALNINLSMLKLRVSHEYILIGVAIVPIVVAFLHRFSVGIARRQRGRDGVGIQMMNIPLLLRGLVQTSIGWFLLGLSLWMTIQAVRPEPTAFTTEDYLRLTGINAAAYIVGFVAFFMPGGAGAREYVLALLLAGELMLTGFTSTVALGLGVVISLVLRLVWTIAEFVMIGLLYRFISPVSHPAAPAPQQNKFPACSE